MRNGVSLGYDLNTSLNFWLVGYDLNTLTKTIEYNKYDFSKYAGIGCTLSKAPLKSCQKEVLNVGRASSVTPCTRAKKYARYTLDTK